MAGNKRKVNEALGLLEEEQFTRNEIAEYMKEAIKTAYKKISNDALLEVDIDDNFNIKMHEVRIVVENDKDDYEDYEMTLEEAQERYNPNVKIGDKITTEVTMDVFGRTDSNKIKNMLKQKIREAQKNREYDYFKAHEGEIMTGVVERIDVSGNYAMINLGFGQLARLNKKAMIPGEKLVSDQEIKVYVESVENEIPDKRKQAKDAENGENEAPKMKKGIFIQISRRNDKLVVRLFENVVTEIATNGKPGPVEILGIAREPGKRCKVVVDSSDPNIDPIGACVGVKGTRAKSIQDELGGEKIDIVKYDRDLKQFIANSLSPAQIKDPQNDIILNEDTNEAYVIVPDDKSSLAIGKSGINTKLASKLINTVSQYKGKTESWNIKIKSETRAEEEGIRNGGAFEIFMRPEVEEVPVAEVEEVVETPVVEETPVIEELPEVEIPAVVEEPAVEETPVVEEIPAVEENVIDDATIDDIVKEMNNFNKKEKDVEVKVEEDDEDNYEDDEYLDRLSEYEDLYE